MSSESKSNWPDKLAGGAIRLLIAAIATYYAVCYIRSIWQPLLIIAGVAAAIALVVYALKQRHRGW